MKYVIGLLTCVFALFLTIKVINYVDTKITVDEPTGGPKTDISVFITMIASLASTIGFIYFLSKILNNFFS